jgi:hypothetical protein
VGYMLCMEIIQNKNELLAYHLSVIHTSDFRPDRKIGLDCEPNLSGREGGSTGNCCRFRGKKPNQGVKCSQSLPLK